jgi:hypothetical protein
MKLEFNLNNKVNEIEVDDNKTLVVNSVDFKNGKEFSKTGFNFDFKIKKGITPIGTKQEYFTLKDNLYFSEIITPDMIGTKVYLTETKKIIKIPNHCVKITISIVKDDEYLILTDLSVL